MLNIVRGDLTIKPEASKLIGLYFESIKEDFEGTLYIGYPIIGTANGGFQVDALLITREKGLVIFHLVEGADNTIDYKDIQDESYTKIQSKLFQYKELTKKRDLAVIVNVATYSPAWSSINEPDEDYPCLISDDDLKDYISSLPLSDGIYYEKTLSVLQSITTIRKNRSREYVRKVDSRGAKLKTLEDSVANLDRQQSSAVIETVKSVQRIRGLAGSGKTIILALKVAYLHAKNPDWKIAVTFNTRSLKKQFKTFIRMFTYEHISEEPNWDKIDVIHAWGTYSLPGIYSDICKDHDIEYFDFRKAKSLTSHYGQEFDAVCQKALTEIPKFKTKYDVIVIDEAQDFSKDFLKICYEILNPPKRLIYAYDELQSLNKKSMDSPENIFGVDGNNLPQVKLKNEVGKPKEDIVLYKCYRNSLEILASAHALGFGIYRKEGLVQIFENKNIWNEIGYKLFDSVLEEGKEVVLGRTSDTSPDFLSNHSKSDDLVKFIKFNNNDEQVEYIVNSIITNLKEDELTLDDIIVINPDPITTKNVVGLFRQKLYDKGINSDLAGVSTSPDIFHTGNTITFTGIYRAKGNEAAMVYVINSQYCAAGYELSKKRNILFTAMTRSKAWVRVCGYGGDMQLIVDEFDLVKKNKFRLKFKYPTKSEREHMNIVNRDMSAEEKNKLKRNERNLNELLIDLREGRIKKEDIPTDMVDSLKSLLDL